MPEPSPDPWEMTSAATTLLKASVRQSVIDLIV